MDIFEGFEINDFNEVTLLSIILFIGFGIFTVKMRKFLLHYPGRLMLRKDALEKEKLYSRKRLGNFMFHF